MQYASEPSDSTDHADKVGVDWPGQPLSGDGSPRLRGGAASVPHGRLLRVGPDEVQSGASPLPQPSLPAATTRDGSELSRWRSLDSAHQLTCAR